MLFLKYLGDMEHEHFMEAELMGKPYVFIIDGVFRWETYAGPRQRTARLITTRP
jgi:type I restriction enzyme M protein